MNCFNHPDRPAVIQCKECGKGFCHEEAVLFKNGLCPDCQKKMLDEQLHRQQLLIQQEEEQRRQLEEQRAAEQKATYEEERAWYLKVFKYSMYVGIPLTILLLVIFIGEDKGGFLKSYFNMSSGMGIYNILSVPFIGPGFVVSWFWSGKLLKQMINSSTPNGGGCIMSFFLYVFLRVILFMLLSSVSLVFFIINTYKAFKPMKK